MSEIQAKASCLAEAMERYLGHYTGREPRRRATWAAMEAEATARGSLRLRCAASWYAADLAMRAGQLAEAENHARLALDLIDACTRAHLPRLRIGLAFGSVIAVRMLPDPRQAILFVGYADPETPGGRLKASSPGETFVFSAAAGEVTRNCEVQEFDLTAHANREALLAEATLIRPPDRTYSWFGKRGQHSEHLGYMLAELQHLQRVHPGARG